MVPIEVIATFNGGVELVVFEGDFEYCKKRMASLETQGDFQYCKKKIASIEAQRSKYE